MNNLLKGSLVAVACAGFFACASSSGSTGTETTAEGAAATPESAEMVKCAGVNECKGTGACAGEGHSCAGQNECKGKGWVKVATADECTTKGGTPM